MLSGSSTGMHFLSVLCISWTGIIMILTVFSGAASTMQHLTENSFPSAPTIVARSIANRSGKNTHNQKSKFLFFTETVTQTFFRAALQFLRLQGPGWQVR